MKRLFARSHRHGEMDWVSFSGPQPRSLRGGAVLLAVFLAASVALAAETAARRGMVSSVNPLATEAGLNILKSGGNAIDAAVAVGFTLGVVDTPNSGIGGGCFLLIRLANGKVVAIDGRERAPAAATRDLFVRHGRGDTALSQTGALASGVPGEVAAFEYAVKQYGRKPWKELILPAAHLAGKGFPISGGYASRLRSVADALSKFAASRAIFLKDGKPPVAGHVLTQADLAKTYRAIAEQGSDWFYRGPFAEATEKWMRANGGIMTAADFANYHIVLREPVVTTYRGYKVVSFPPPSSGGVHLIQMLNILEKFDLKSLDEVTRLHVIAETMKLAFADRAYWLGDPDFVKVPRGLVSKQYAASLARKIHLEHTTAVPTHGTPPKAKDDFFKQQPALSSPSTAGVFDGRTISVSLSPQQGERSEVRGENPAASDEFSRDPIVAASGRGHDQFGSPPSAGPPSPLPPDAKHTTHWSVADAEGNWVACTATINTTYGSKVVIPGTGVVMNNQMDDFSIQPGVPNAFGLIGAEANAVGPGKRPLSSMTPTIVLKRGKPVIAVGAAGGPKIISAVLQELIALLDLGMSPTEALAAPRIHHQWSPDELMVEKSLPDPVQAALAGRGHKVKELNALSVSQLVTRSPDGKSFLGAADPRAEGVAEGW